MPLFTKGIELFLEMRGRNDQLRAEGREEIRNRLRQRGLDLDELLRTNSSAAEETAANDGDETANPPPRHCAPAPSRIYSIHIHIPGVPTPNHDTMAGRL